MQELIRLGDKIAVDGSSWMCKVVLLTLGLCVFLSGCKKDPPVSSAESKSPDGKLVATAHTFANSGFGGGPPTTFVYLNWVTGSQSPTLILSLTGGVRCSRRCKCRDEMVKFNSSGAEV